MTSTSITGKTSSSLCSRSIHEWKPAAAKSLAARLVARCWQAYCRWDDRRRQHRHLAELDDRLLADIGLSRAQARGEASRWLLM